MLKLTCMAHFQAMTWQRNADEVAHHACCLPESMTKATTQHSPLAPPLELGGDNGPIGPVEVHVAAAALLSWPLCLSPT